MKTLSKILLSSIILIFSLSGCKKTADVTPADTDGNASATINNTSWVGSYCGAISGGSGTQVTQTIIIEKDPKDKNSDVISIGISYPKTETGIKTYASGTSTPVSLLRITYQSKQYSSSGIGLTGISTSVKITENTAPNSLLEPGKIVGEFSGTLKTSDNKETITITNGKFTGVRVL
jgi:hypothetical protein